MSEGVLVRSFKQCGAPGWMIGIHRGKDSSVRENLHIKEVKACVIMYKGMVKDGLSSCAPRG